MREMYIIDRFEGKTAVMERQSDKAVVDIAKAELPAGARVGDVIIYDGKNYRIDETETQRLRDEVRKLQDDLFM